MRFASSDDSAVASLGDQDVTLLAPGFGDDSTDSAGSTKRMEQPSAEDLGLDVPVEDGLPEPSSESADATASIELDDLVSALMESDTVEQPIAQSVGSDVFGGSESVDLNLDTNSTPGGESAAPGKSGLLDSHTMTMTEVGTKLDLARAYMDIGDPDGARSILEEVLEEGDEDQQNEAKGIIDSL